MMKAIDIFRLWLKITLFFVVTLILAPWYFLVLLVFYRWRYCIGPKLVQFYFTVCLLVFRVHIEQVGNNGIKIKKRKGFLILANHASFLDIFVLSAQFGTVFLSKSEIKYYPVIGQIAWLMGVIFLKRDAAHERVRVLNAIAGRCTEQVVAVFPQGTTSVISDQLPFNRGIFKVIELNPSLSLLPVTLYYKEDTAIAWKKPQSFGNNFMRVCSQDKIHLKILIHNPLTIEDYRGKTASQICRTVEHIILEPLRQKYEG